MRGRIIINYYLSYARDYLPKNMVFRSDFEVTLGGCHKGDDFMQKDRIDERDFQLRMHRSIVKFWNVQYQMPEQQTIDEDTPLEDDYSDEQPVLDDAPKTSARDQLNAGEDLPSASYGQNTEFNDVALEIYERLQAEARADEEAKAKEISDLLESNAAASDEVDALLDDSALDMFEGEEQMADDNQMIADEDADQQLQEE